VNPDCLRHNERPIERVATGPSSKYAPKLERIVMEQTHVVPSEFAGEAETVLTHLREAAKAQGKDAEIYLLNSNSARGFEPVTMGMAVLYIGSGSAAWLTKKWVETYLWDYFLKAKLDKPSKEFLDWLGSKLPGGTSTPAEPSH
jgi:hypothetical protein